MIQVGKTSFSIDSIKSISKEEFIESNKHINADLAQIWESINDTSSEGNKAAGNKHEKHNAKKANAIPVPKHGVQKADN